MASEVEWYDFVCFGIVGVAFVGALWVLYRKEGGPRLDDDTVYESLLVGQLDSSRELNGTTVPRAHVGTSMLWTSCWKGVHPGWLLATRVVSFLVMAGFLTRDIVQYGGSIYMYYTDVDPEDWFQLQVPICALLIAAQAGLAIHVIMRTKTEPVYYRNLWSTSWRNIHPIWLFLYRAFAFVCLSWMLLDLVAMDGASEFKFYTQWTFTLVMFYFALGTIVSAHGCWVHSKATKLPIGNGEAREEVVHRDLEESRSNGTKLRKRYGEEEFLRRAGFWGYMMQTVYQASSGAVVITDIVFWCVIVPFLSTERLGLNWLMGCMHTLNAFFLLVDSGLNSLPFPWFRIAYFIIWTCTYVMAQWIVHFSGVSEWPYPFLQLNTPWAPLWYFSLAVLHIPCYGIYALIIKAKNTILPRLCPHSFLKTY